MKTSCVCSENVAEEVNKARTATKKNVQNFELADNSISKCILVSNVKNLDNGMRSGDILVN